MLLGSTPSLLTEISRGAIRLAGHVRIAAEITHARKYRRLEHMVPAASSTGGLQSEQKLSVAPMMDWTDIHYRQLARLISRHTWLYTEMLVDQTVLHAEPRDKWMWFPPEQHPIVCQLGGSNPESLAKAAVVVEQYGYDEINLNCGCPSDRVAGAGCFGASLMLQPENVAACCAAMREATSTEITVKCRIGVDDTDSYVALCNFIRVVAEQGRVSHFIIHARKCILKGLSPAQNRTIPPLRRGWVYALQRDFPELDFSLNGVVEGCHEAAAINAHFADGACVAGVMIGRRAYEQPWQCLADADRAVFGADRNAAESRRQVLKEYAAYGDAILGKWGTKRDGSKVPNVKAVVKPLLGIFHGERGTKRWKQALDRILKDAHQRPELTVSQVIEEALPSVPADVVDAPPASCQLPEPSISEVPPQPEGFESLNFCTCERNGHAPVLQSQPSPGGRDQGTVEGAAYTTLGAKPQEPITNGSIYKSLGEVDGQTCSVRNGISSPVRIGDSIREVEKPRMAR